MIIESVRANLRPASAVCARSSGVTAEEDLPGEVAKRLGNGLQNRHTPVRIRSSPPRMQQKHQGSSLVFSFVGFGGVPAGPARCERSRL